MVVVNAFKTEDEAIRLANDTEYGLSAAVFTQDINRALRVSKRIHAGGVQINSVIKINDSMPFGGMKKSSIGRELGKYVYRHYTEPKAIYIK